LVQGLLPLLSLYLIKLLIDTVTAGIASSTPLLALKPILLLIGLAGLTALVSDVSRSLAGLAQAAQSEEVTDYVHALLHTKSIQVDLEYYENAEYYNTLHRAQAEASYRPSTILLNLTQGLQSGISLLGILILLLRLHWSIAVILVLATIPGIFARLKYTGKFYWRYRDWTDKERQAYYFHTMLTQSPHAKEVRLFNLGSLFNHRFQHLRQVIRQEKLSLASQRATIDLVTQGSATLAVFVTCGAIAYQTLQGAITLGDFVMYYQAFQRGQGFLREVLSNLVSLYENSLFLADFYSFLELKPMVEEPHQPQPMPQAWQTGIEFRHVCFEYPNSQRSVLRDVSFSIHPGETIALVGENGAGKTTLIKLLCRLYDPTDGAITLNGIDLRQFCIADLRSQINVLFQDYVQYQLTAQENIWLGNIDLPSHHDQIFKAARNAGADAVIRKLPQGYDTRLGKWFESGEELSIGQWQKVALARSFVRDAQILILDEPTSALDAKAEAEVFKKFRQLVQGKTAILISHRLSTIKMADRILVLDGGTLAEQGTHNQLMQHQGIYAHLYETQAQQYRP
jgi:ATP-binding cassette subfamily B protein